MDVANGVLAGLRELGHPTGHYRLHNRIMHAYRCLTLRWQDAGHPADNEPGTSEVLFHASSEIVQYALLHEVDWVLFVACGFVHPAVFKMLRRAQVPTAMILTESPYQDQDQLETARLVDVVWTNERTSVDFFRDDCRRAGYLRHAYLPDVHKPRAYEGTRWPNHDVVFVGTLWQERIDLLCAIDWSGIDLGIYGLGYLLDPDEYPRNREKRAYLEPYLHLGEVSEPDTVELYGRAKIGINQHRTSVMFGSTQHITHGESMNPRCYQQPATGGALLISDARKEVVETLDAPVFLSPEELSARMRYYLDRPAERLELVDHLRQQIAGHTFRERAAQIISDLQKGAANGY